MNITHHNPYSLSVITKLFVRIIFFLLLLVFQFGCKSSEQFNSIITFTTVLNDFTITVDAEGMLEAKKNHLIITPPTPGYRIITYLVPEGSEVKKGEVLVIFQSENLEKEYKNAQDELEIAEAEAEQKEVQFKVDRLLLESQLKSFEAAAATAKLQLPKLEFAAPTEQEIKRLEIQKSDAQVKKIRKKLSDLENIQKEERKYMEMKVKQAEGKLKSHKRFMEQLVIDSPIDGIVTYAINRWTDEKVQVGDQLFRGWSVVKIPDLSIMQVKMQISETESQRLKKGQKTIITVSSVGEFRLSGKVSKVDKVAKPIKRGSKVKKVDVIVEIDSTNIELMPGLTAECSIIVEEFKNALVVPKECIFENDSIKIVYIRDGGRFKPRPIELSHQGDDFVTIQNGLAGGEKLALREPGSSFIKWPDNLKTQ